jgi:acetyl-CoA carboxylase carboxyltransferase component
LKEELLEQKRQQAQAGGGEKRIQAQHQRGKLTARERIELLVDPGSFHELGMFITHRATRFGMADSHPPGDGVVTGWGTIEGRQVYLFAQDFTVIGGSVGEEHARKVAHLMDLAYENGCPLIGLNDSGGARIQEGVEALAGYGEIFFRNVRNSGVIPQISVIMGPCAGGAVYSPAITDFVFMVNQTSHMFITGPKVIQAVTHEEISSDDLGGALVHTTRSGVAHFTAEDDQGTLALVRWLLTFLPSNNLDTPPLVKSSDDRGRKTHEISDHIPASADDPYDIHLVIQSIGDDGEFLEVMPEFAKNLVIGFCRLDGNVVGVVANQPDHLAGVLDIDSSDKGARFIRFCNAFHISLLTMVDTPGFLPGVAQEHGGIIRHGAKLLYAYAEATVPKVSLILRKAYGGAYIVMSSKHLRGDINLALPGAEIAVMGPEGAVKIVFKDEIASAQQPEAREAQLVAQYRDELANPYEAAGRGYLDDVIQPEECRIKLIAAFEMLQNKRQNLSRRKNGNIPL